MPAAFHFETVEGLRRFEAHMSGLIRSDQFDIAEAELRDLLGASGGPVGAIIGEIALADVAILGWEKLYAEMTKLDRKGKRITAVGINLSGHIETDEPGFEVAYYDDAPFRFSSASRDDILSACARYGAPWMGRFVDTGSPLPCRGLAPLKSWIDGYPHRYHEPRYVPSTPPENFEDFQYGLWFLYTAIHAAFAREVGERGMPRQMPVIIGQHDFGPYLDSVQMATKVCDHLRTTEAILAEQSRKARAHYDKITDDMVRELREAREALQGWPWWRNRDKRKTYAAMRQSREGLILSRNGIKALKPTFELADRDFENLIGELKSRRAKAG